jgi:hypothetical protein
MEHTFARLRGDSDGTANGVELARWAGVTGGLVEWREEAQTPAFHAVLALL